MPEELPEIIAWLDETGRGKAEVTYRLRDWLISRQRYWGTPIPIIYCDDCGMVPVPEDQLPVVLPLDAEFTPTGQIAAGDARQLRQHDLSAVRWRRRGARPTRWTPSSIRPGTGSATPSRTSRTMPVRPGDGRSSWTPVDLYCGGIEHAILHLLYARFFTKVMRDLGLVDHGEPFLGFATRA